MAKQMEDFDSMSSWVRYSHWLKLCDAIWHFLVIDLVEAAMIIAEVPLFLSLAFQYYMIFKVHNAVDANHDARVEKWLLKYV